MPSLNFSFHMTPVAKGRPRLTKFGRCYTPRRTRDYEDAIISSLRSVLPKEFKLLSGPIELECMFQFRRPKSAPKTRTHHTVKPDVDNCVKSVKDAFNGEVWVDDCQVIKVIASKEYANEDKVTVKVSY